MPVAKVARHASRLFARLDTPITLKALLNTSGIGMANALRIIASIELGQRVASHANTWQKLDVSPLMSARRTGIVFATVSGGGRHITTIHEPVNSIESTTVTARRICAKVLADNAWGVAIAIGGKSAQTQPGLSDLSLLSDIKELTNRLQIKLLSFEYVHENTSDVLYGAVS